MEMMMTVQKVRLQKSGYLHSGRRAWQPQPMSADRYIRAVGDGCLTFHYFTHADASLVLSEGERVLSFPGWQNEERRPGSRQERALRSCSG